MESVQRIEVGGGEALVVDEVAEQVPVAHERERIPPLRPRHRHQPVLQPIDDLDGLPLLVDALGVARPTGDHRRGQGHRTAGVEVGAHHGDQPLRNPVGRLGAQARHGVPDLRVGEALDQCPLVVREIDSGHRLQGGSGLLVHVAQQESGEQRVLRDVVDESVSAEVADVAEGLVARVEQPQLHQLVRGDVVDHLHAGVLERRPTEGERILQRPLGERFRGDGPGVLEVVPCGELVDDVGCGDGGDAIHHRVGELRVVRDPLRQCGILQSRERGEGRPSDVSVPFDVVARHDRERREPAVLATGQGLADESEGGARHGARRQIGPYGGVLGVELAGGGREVVAALGHGERDDAGVGVRELLDHRLGIVRREEVLGDGSDDRGVPRAVGVPERQGVEAVLSVHDVLHATITRQHAHAADSPARRGVDVAAQQPIHVHRLVGAVEPADTEVHDAGGDRGPVVSRHVDVVGKSVEGGGGQLHERVS